jgi:cytochrome c peroxidase
VARRSRLQRRLGCFQTWQSCATCHPDGRDDALYWDLPNDGVNNTKNTKSLLMATLTPPAMWRGVRPGAMAAIQAGFRHIEFAEPQSNAAEQVEAYLRDMRAVPSPDLDARTLEPPRTNSASCAKCHVPGVPRGTLTDAARRGTALFEGRAGCAACHPHPTFTTGKQADPGLGTSVQYDIPSLVEVWRTAPYMYSGEAITLRAAVIDHNFLQRRGRTRELTEQEVEDLLAYVRSL